MNVGLINYRCILFTDAKLESEYEGTKRKGRRFVLLFAFPLFQWSTYPQNFVPKRVLFLTIG